MLLGSTEWAEAHAEELRQKAVAYVNTDGNGRGFLGMSGSHTLEHLVNDVARDVLDPEAKVPVWKRAQAKALADAASAEDRKAIRGRRRPAPGRRWARAATTPPSSTTWASPA